MVALGACARASVEAGLDPDPDGAYRHLISIYDELVPAMSPFRTSCTLWHPDLHAGNIIVDGNIDNEDHDADSFGLSGIIDWQRATILPYYLQYSVPPAYEFTPSEEPLVQYSAGGKPKVADGYDDLCEEDKTAAYHALRRAWRAYVHRAMMQDEDAPLARDLYESAVGASKMRGFAGPVTTVTRGGYSLASLARSIAAVQAVWNVMVGVSDESRTKPLVPFPPGFSDEDKRRMEQEEAREDRIVEMYDDVLVPLGVHWAAEGLVPVEQYDEAKKVMENARQATLAAAASAEERDQLAQEWPFQDGKPAFTLDRCW